MYNEVMRAAYKQAKLYASLRAQGMSKEGSRSVLTADYRQHFVMTCNLRTALHLLDMRYKQNAQWECQCWAMLFHKELTNWVPEVMEWYNEARLGKGMLAP